MKLSKRAFIRLLTFGGTMLSGVAASAVGAAGDSFPTGKARLLQGPMLGAVTKSTARVWIRASDEFNVAVEFSRFSDFRSSSKTPQREVRASDDLTAVIVIESLQPGTQYFYRVLLDDEVPSYSVSSTSQVFRTAPAGMASFSVALGSCARYAEDSQQPIWDIVSRRDPSLFFWLGDNIYGDSPRAEVLADEYQRQRGVRSFVPMGARIPQLATWDDHDFGENDGDRTFSGKDVALDVFRRYWANPNCGSEAVPGVFFTYNYGGVDFFFLDVRYYRDPNTEADRVGKTMLGTKQRNWLKTELKRSKASFKILISGSGWSAAKGPGGDSWAAFLHERDELFDYIRDENISGVVLLSGDTHVAELNAIPWSERGGYDMYDLTSSPLAQDTSDSWLERRPERRIRQAYFGSVNFGLLMFDMTLEDPLLEYNVVNYIGDDVWEPLKIRASELTNGTSTWSSKMDALSRHRYESDRDGGEYYQPLPIFRD